MTTFLYYLPFMLLGLSILSYSLAYLINGNKKDVLGLNEPYIRFYYLVIPIIVVIVGFVVAAEDFKNLYIPWSIYGIYIFTSICVEAYIIHLRGKVADEKISEFTKKLKERMEEIKREEENK